MQLFFLPRELLRKLYLFLLPFPSWFPNSSLSRCLSATTSFSIQLYFSLPLPFHPVLFINSVGCGSSGFAQSIALVASLLFIMQAVSLCYLQIQNSLYYCILTNFQLKSIPDCCCNHQFTSWK